MFDQDTLRPVIIAMSLYLITSVTVPRFATKPTNIEFIDDIVAFLGPFVEAGAKTLSLKACGPDPETELEVIAEVAARLRR